MINSINIPVEISTLLYFFNSKEFYFHLYIIVFYTVLFFTEKCRLFWSEVENFCRTFDLLKNI